MERKAQTLRSSRGVRPALPPVSNSSHLPPCTLRTCAKEPRHSLGQNFFQSADPPWPPSHAQADASGTPEQAVS